MTGKKDTLRVLITSYGIPTSRKIGAKWGIQDLSYGRGSILQSGTVAGGISGTRRAEGAHLAKGQIAAQHGEAFGGERFGQGAKQRGLGISAGAMGEDQAFAVRAFRKM